MHNDRPDKLYTSLATPSITNAYSIAMQYIKDWFFSKFSDKYFKSVYIDQKHPLDEFRKFSIKKGLKKLKPSVSISPHISFDYDRETVDLYQADITDYLRRNKGNNVFFSDPEKNLNLSVLFEVLEMTFDFRIRVSTRAQQIDLYKYLFLAFRFGATQGEDLIMDCHIPYAIMMQLAIDAGFEVKDDKVVDVIGFVRYLNKHSIVPVLYKYRTVNAKDEFFIRVGELYTWISCLEKPSVDEGERVGQVLSNFMIEFPVTLRIPAPQFYAYHSACEHERIKVKTDSVNDPIGLYNIKIPDIPDADEHNWNQYITTEYYSDEIRKPIDIEMEELFSNSDLYNIIKYTRDLYISPSIFMNMKFYNNGKELKYDIDWNTFKVNILDKIEHHVIQIAVYTDLDYVKSVLYNKENFKNRFTDTDRKEEFK